MRIKLPGKIKTKIIMLILLVFICIGIFIKEGIENRENSKSKETIEKTYIK